MFSNQKPNLKIVYVKGDELLHDASERTNVLATHRFSVLLEPIPAVLEWR